MTTLDERMILQEEKLLNLHKDLEGLTNSVNNLESDVSEIKDLVSKYKGFFGGMIFTTSIIWSLIIFLYEKVFKGS